jgi:uroporphyrinogen decarboxylase
LENILLNLTRKAFTEKRRLIVPLVGFPGVKMVGSSIKLAQQNYGVHIKVLKSVAETFKPDAIFPLMDLSVEANALGRFTLFPKDESATVVKDEFSFSEFENLESIDISFDSRVAAYVETLKLMKNELSPSILRGAYVTGPYTLAALLMGAEEAAVSTVVNPEELHKICTLAAEKITDYVKILISSGAQIICILEPSAVMLGPDQFEQFSVKYVSSICEICKSSDVVSVYHICGNTMHLINKMTGAGVDALSLDSLEAGVDLSKAAEKLSRDIVLIGNISPIGSLLKGKPGDVKKEVLQLLKSMEQYPNFILSTGCNLPLETPVENILAFMETGRSYRVN